MNRTTRLFPLALCVIICFLFTSLAIRHTQADKSASESTTVKPNAQSQTSIQAQKRKLFPNSLFKILTKTDDPIVKLRGGNSVPTITAEMIVRMVGSPATSSIIANVNDAEDSEDELIVEVNGMDASGINTVTSGGVSISNVSISSSGEVTADVLADCSVITSNVDFTLRVIDSGELFDEDTLTVNITPNTPPTLSYSSPQSVAFDGSLDVTPSEASENGMITFEVLPGHGLITSPTVGEDGTVSITNAQPAGEHTVTVRATDNCGDFTDASFTLIVGCPTITVEPESISNATYGVPYNQMFTASGGTGSYSFSYTGTLPNGLMLDSGGNLTGSPTEVGDFNFTIIAADSDGIFSRKPSSKKSSPEAIGCNGSRSYTLTVAKSDTTTEITNAFALESPTVVGEAVTIEWEVTPSGEAIGTPTGTVTININGVDECIDISLPTTQCSVTPMTSGSLDIVATYSGDTNFNGSTSSNAFHTVNSADTTTTITNTIELATPTATGQSYPVKWSVTVNSPGSGTPTGYVRVSDGVEECVAPIEDGQCNLTSTSAGMKTITARYEGDDNFNSSTSEGVPHTVACTTNPVVVNNNDEGEGSLRQAILSACVGDTITFDSSVSGSIALTSGELEIEKDLTIQGPGANKLSVNANSSMSEGEEAFRVFFIGSGEFRQEANRCARRTHKRTEGETYPPVVNISGLTIADGYSSFCDGGGIQNYGVLTLRDSFVVNNGAEIFGGGIYNDGELTIVNSTIAYNGALVSGGGIFNTEFGYLTVINSTVSTNISLGSDGGGITTDGIMNVTNTTITGNTHVTLEGGGGESRHVRTEGPLALGGGGISAFGLEVLNNTIVAGNCQIAFIIEPPKRTLLKRIRTEGSEPPAPPCLQTPEDGGPAFTITPNDIEGDEVFCEGCKRTEGSGEIINSGNNNLIGDANTSGGLQDDVDGNIVGNNGAGTIDINRILDTKLYLYGGTTPTHHLVPRSPAIDAGDNEKATDDSEVPLTTDQRGATYPRIRNGNYDAVNTVDIGSFEYARKVPVDFDGDGRSDFAVIEMPLPERDVENRPVKPIGGDILANERRRIWSYDYRKLLGFRSGRGFVELPKDVLEMLETVKQNGSVLNKPSTEGEGLAWIIRRSGSHETLTYFLGSTDSVFVPADYDGDGESDAAIWRQIPSCETEGCAAGGMPTHQFIIISSFDGSVHEYNLGTSMSDPTVVGDYDGDGRDDPAVYDSATGMWSWLGGASHGTLETQIWMPGGVPTPGDYNGDGKNDFAVQLPPVAASDAAKFRIAYNDGEIGPISDLPLTYGLSIYQVIPGDYDDDGVTDIAQGNLSGTGIIWRVLRSSSGYTLQSKIPFGTVATDFTVQGDYDGDGKLDRAVYRATGSPEDGVFRVLQSSNNMTVTFDWGGELDNPVAFFNTH